MIHNQAVNGTAFPRRLWLCSKAARYLSVERLFEDYGVGHER